MRTSLIYRTLLAAAALATVACASNPPDEAPLAERLAERGYSIGEQVDKVQNYRINGWNSVDRRNVIFNAGPSRHYLVTLRTSCDGLRSAETLAFSTTVGNLTDLDSVVVRGAGNWVERCPIESIHRLERLPRAAAAETRFG